MTLELTGRGPTIVAAAREAAVLGNKVRRASGAQKLTSMQFIATRTSDASLEALAEASRLARQQAELMVKAAGGKLGQLIELSTNPGNQGGLELAVAGTSTNMRGDQAARTVKPATVDLKVTVYARWALLPSP